MEAMANLSLTTDKVMITEGGESTGEMGEMVRMGEMGMSMSGENHHETHFRGMDMPGDDSGNNIVNFTDSW